MNKVTKIVGLLLVIALMFALVACTPAAPAADAPAEAPAEDAPAEDAPAEDAPADAKLKVFFTNAWNTAPFCAPLNQAAQEKADELGIELTIVDGKGDAKVQLDQVESAIDQGYDGILYFPADKEGSIAVVNALNESGMAYAIIDSMVDDSVKDSIPIFAGPDNVYMGEVAGQACIDIMGEEGKIVILEGGAGTDPATNRQAGFLNIIEQYPGIEILATQNTGWDPAKSMTIMQDYITRFGDDIDFVYTHDDGIFQGAQQAIDQAGMTGEILAVSTGANNVGCAAIDAGTLYGSVLHSAKEEGALGLEAIYRVMTGTVEETWLKCQSPLVTKENIEEWRGWGW